MADLLKMSELVARAGVEKSTVQHYLREGLLPGPARRPHRNMAWYSAELVGRIRLIRQLQTERNLPLARIRQLLEDHPNVEELRRWLDQRALMPEPATEPMRRSELLRQTALTREQLDRLEALRFLRPTRKGRTTLYSANDVAVARSVAAMRRAGLCEKNGFEIEDMALYIESVRSLFIEELALFSRVLGKVPARRVLELAESGIEGTSALLMALRRRVILDVLEDGPDAALPATRD